jgi:hypothetical protein
VKTAFLISTDHSLTSLALLNCKMTAGYRVYPIDSTLDRPD